MSHPLCQHTRVINQQVAYPLSLLGVSINAMQAALSGLKVGRVPEPREMGTFVDIQMAVGFPVRGRGEGLVGCVRCALPTCAVLCGCLRAVLCGPADPFAAAASLCVQEYFEEEARYAIKAPPRAAAPPPPPSKQQEQQPQQPQQRQEPAAAAAAAASNVVEADVVVPPPDSSSSSSSSSSFSSSGMSLSRMKGPDGKPLSDSEGQRRWDQFRRSKFFRVCIK
jgi:hypothetical protein